jgi:hypothetical protein
VSAGHGPLTWCDTCSVLLWDFIATPVPQCLETIGVVACEIVLGFCYNNHWVGAFLDLDEDTISIYDFLGSSHASSAFAVSITSKVLLILASSTSRTPPTMADYWTIKGIVLLSGMSCWLLARQ